MAHCFTLTRSEDLSGISSSAYLYLHKSGAELIHIKNSDDNKVFCIAFKTPPENNTGVFHVLEHCVLCGSEKYPVKDPFSELKKGTIHTFLNAMTYRDKTLYPVAGTNEKDFLKMADIYLDAVFFPLVREKKEVMLQEGVNRSGAYRDGANQNACRNSGYGGIVYNEMSGSFAKPGEYLIAKAYEKLLPNSPYMYDAGGLPSEIPYLTYEYLISCHEKYYRPRNAYFYLYGNMEIEKYLEHIDRNYLSRFTDFGFKAQTPDIVPLLKETEFEISENTGQNLSLTAILANDCNSPKLVMGLQVLRRYLLKTEASPFKTLISREMSGCDISDFLDIHLPNPVLGVMLKSRREQLSAARVWESLLQAAADTAKNGFDKELLNSAFSALEFRIREEDYGHRPKGLQYMLDMSSRWLYGKDPFGSIRQKELLDEVKNGSGYLDEILHGFFLDNKAVVMGTAKFSPIDLEAKALSEYQKTADSEKTLAAIPVLPISDIKKKYEKIPFEADGCTRISHTKLKTDGIIYMKFMFSLDPSFPYINNISLLLYLLGKLDTKNYRYYELDKKIAGCIGGMSFAYQSFPSNKDKSFNPQLTASVKVLEQNIASAFEYTNEIVTGTLFADEKRIAVLINEYRTKLRNIIINEGHTWALSRASANLHPKDMFDETVSGLTFYDYLCSANDISALCERLGRLYLRVFCKDNYSFHYTCENDNAYEYAVDFAEYLPKTTPQTHKRSGADYVDFSDNAGETDSAVKIEPAAQTGAPPFNSRYVIETPIYFNAMSIDYRANGYEYSGSTRVLANILNNEYLLKRIRLEGGAYGVGCSFKRHGTANFYSHRDPYLERSFDVFRGTRSFAENLNLTDRQTAQYIIGALNALDKPNPPNIQGTLALARHLCGITDDDIQKERDEIIATTQGELKRLSGMLEIKPENTGICAIGRGEEKNTLFAERILLV